MSIELFKKPASAKKRAAPPQKTQYSDEESLSESGYEGSEASDSEIEAAQSRLKEAKSYLSSLESQAKKQKKTSPVDHNEEESLDFGEIDAAEMDREIIASRLQQDTKVARGKLFECVAEKYTAVPVSESKVNMPDGRVPTGVAWGPEGLVYLIGKGSCVYQYRYTPGSGLSKLHVFKSGGDELLSVAVSGCGTFLAAGSRSGAIFLWSVRSTAKGFAYKALGIMKQHRGAVQALAFRMNSTTLYSASADRTVKVWSLDPEPMYQDTLFGHQDAVPAIACLARETCMTVGSRDRTARLWKIADETQLLFRAPESTGGAQECVAMLDEEAFVSGSDLGALSLWSVKKKKPSASVNDAHSGYIGALTALPFTDLVASAGSDGRIRVWQARPGQELTLIRDIPCAGIVTSMQWSPCGRHLAACIGREPRLGRWEVQKAAKNSLHIYTFAIEN